MDDRENDSVCVFKRKVIFMRSEGIGRELREGV